MFDKLTPDYIHAEYTRYDWVDIETNFLWRHFSRVPGLPIINGGFVAEVDTCIVIVGFLYTQELAMFVLNSKNNTVEAYRLRTNSLYLKILNLVNTRFKKVPVDSQRVNLNSVAKSLCKKSLHKLDKQYLTPMLERCLHVIPDYPTMYVVNEDNFVIILGEDLDKNFVAIFDIPSLFYSVVYDTDLYTDIVNDSSEDTPDVKLDKYSYTLDELADIVSAFYTYGNKQHILPIFIKDEFKRLCNNSSNVDLLAISKVLKNLGEGESK